MSIRLFAALAIPDEAAERLTPLQRGVGGARWAPLENLHLTLRFFGEIAEDVADDLDAALEEGARGRRPFEIRLKGAGFFGGDDPHALVIGAAANPALNELAGTCERAARRVGLKPEPRKFTPHVTLAYLNRPDITRVIAFEKAHALFVSPSWQVDSFGLYSSWLRKDAPNLYRLEAVYPLLG